jgi:hypothetical protein
MTWWTGSRPRGWRGRWWTRITSPPSAWPVTRPAPWSRPPTPTAGRGRCGWQRCGRRMAVLAHGPGIVKRQPAHRPHRRPGSSPALPYSAQGADPLGCRALVSPGEPERTRASRQRPRPVGRRSATGKRAKTQQAEARNEVGVYVYALPHYIRHPYARPRAARFSKSAAATATSSCGSAARPGRPRSRKNPSCYGSTGPTVPRLCPPRQPFIALPDAADHSRTLGKSAGREWFLTHTRFLDEIARTLGLHVDVINEGEFDDN